MGGDADMNVPLIDSEQLYQALRRLGRETELVIYPGRNARDPTPELPEGPLRALPRLVHEVSEAEGIDVPVAARAHTVRINNPRLGGSQCVRQQSSRVFAAKSDP